MAKYPAYYGVIEIPFLKLGQFTEQKVLHAREWCVENCEDRFISSDLHPWAFLSEKDAVEIKVLR